MTLRKRHQAAIAEHAARIDAWRDDFVSFATELDVIDKHGSRIAIRPSAMISMFEAQRSGWDIVLKPRQVWFTTWECARDIWYFITQPGARVVLVCQADKDNEAVRELSTRIRVMLGTDDAARASTDGKCGLLGKYPTLGVRENSLTHWSFGDASLRIISAGASKNAAEKKGRAGTIHRLHITEISSFEYARSTMNAILECVPRTNAKSEVVIESTARGAEGLFYELYNAAKSGANSFRPFFFAWMKHREYRLGLEPGEVVKVTTPREKELVRKHGASAEQVKWYRAKVGDKGQDLTDQEYPMDEETCWLVGGRTYLNVERTKLLLTMTIDPIATETFKSSVPDASVRNDLRIWKHPQPRREYVVIADPAEGLPGKDKCAAAVYDRGSGEHVASVHGLWRTHEFARVLERVGFMFNTALVVVERINHGHAVLNALLRLGVAAAGVNAGDKPYPNIYFDDDEHAGWKTGPVQRATALEAFEAAHRKGEWSSPDRDALDEMLKFVVHKTGKVAAAPGANDDRVLVHVIALRILSVPRAGGLNTVPGTGSRWESDNRGWG